jgi:DNA-binding NarL/FixJ family response regulator
MKVLLVDDHPVARRGLSVVVAASLEECEILEAGDAVTALRLACEERPEMILMDAKMPGSMPVDELCRKLCELLPDVVIAIVTAFDDPVLVYGFVYSGARGWLLKDTSEVDIGVALRALLAGQFVIDPRVAKQLAPTIGKPGRGGTINLTERERDVLSLLGRGCANRKIAQELFLSETTVKGYVRDLLRKLNASSRLEAVVRAYELGLVPQLSQG